MFCRQNLGIPWARHQAWAGLGSVEGDAAMANLAQQGYEEQG